MTNLLDLKTRKLRSKIEILRNYMPGMQRKSIGGAISPVLLIQRFLFRLKTIF
jgi:hypothetical protein